MDVRRELGKGLVIPAHPLALDSDRKLDERRQRALTRYYLAAGAGGIAVGVHTTEFSIRDTKFGLLQPVLELAAEESRKREVVKIAGVCGERKQAVAEAELAKSLGYDAILLSLAALHDRSVSALLDHARAIAAVIPVVGFYLQPAVGGRVLSYEFWRGFAEIEQVVAIKIAPFNRYQTQDVVRAVVDSGRAHQIALYTGNDDSIVSDLVARFEFGGRRARIVGGLLGHWAVCTRAAVSLLESIQAQTSSISDNLLITAQQITDMNAAIFDPQHQYRGSIPGIHEILRQQGLLEGRWCLDPCDELSPGQIEEIHRVWDAYPHLHEADDQLIREHLEEWLL
jgi:dihydrodipicolinate synthase/N-acetylneuraminate lyase